MPRGFVVLFMAKFIKGVREVHEVIKRVSKKEFESIKFLVDEVQDNFAQNFVSTNLKWYIEKAVRSKFYFYILTVLTIVCPIVSSIFSITDSEMSSLPFRCLGIIFTGTASASAAFLVMLDCRKKWAVYRNEAEYIKSILARRDYESPEELITKIEESMSETHEEWMSTFKNSK